MKEAKYPLSAQEAQVKACVAKDWFSAYDTTNYIGNIDFSVAESTPGALMTSYLLWAEAKKGVSHDIDESFVQLILTIGRARTFDRHLPPRYLGAFDAARIAFLPYHAIQDVFAVTDFNWNVAPNNRKTREFALLKKRVTGILASETLTFDYLTDAAELKKFILRNFAQHAKAGVARIQITKNNFTHIYNKWRTAVKPTIDFADWDAAKKNGIIDADFFLADILSRDNATLTNKLNILLQNDHYRQAAGKSAIGLTLFSNIGFKDGQKVHADFWRLYDRPPKEEYWDYIVNRRDLLVPQDVRETKGAFFTPRPWVELSQEYLARELGENWQDEYYVWDCCAGTGNLLAGLVNKKNIWASTLDQRDVDVMLQRIDNMNNGLASGDSGANLFPSHVFQFDFLNDPFTKLPQGLQDILNAPEKRKRLVIYINPPYAEAGNKKKIAGIGAPKHGVSCENETYKRFSKLIGTGARELFALFFMRVQRDVSGCILGEFSKLKHLQAPNFKAFRNEFRGDLLSSFIVPSDTFDNVPGKFPIGFFVWRLRDVAFATGRCGDLENRRNPEKTPKLQDSQTPSSESNKGIFTSTIADVYDRKGEFIGKKVIYAPEGSRCVIEWLRQSYDKRGERIAYLRMNGTDVQNNRGIYFASALSANDLHNHFYTVVTKENIVPMSIYMAIRSAIEATWLNDRDQFLYPKDSWRDDEEFQRDCLVYALFHGQNRIKSADGVNHWVPFDEEALGTKDEIKSHFMIDVLGGRVSPRAVEEPEADLFSGTAADSATGGPRSVSCNPSGSLRSGNPTPTARANLVEAVDGTRPIPPAFSAEAQAVLAAALSLYRYYHAQPRTNPNASFYDIRQHFQGVNAKGTMNATSIDEEYNRLLGELRRTQKCLGSKIADGVYRHGFLR